MRNLFIAGVTLMMVSGCGMHHLSSTGAVNVPPASASTAQAPVTSPLATDFEYPKYNVVPAEVDKKDNGEGATLVSPLHYHSEEVAGYYFPLYFGVQVEQEQHKKE